VESDAGISHRIRVGYAAAAGEKVYEVNGARPDRLASMIGRFPVVILSPEKGGVTLGDRRNGGRSSISFSLR